MSAYTSRLVPQSFDIEHDSIVNGNYDFPLSDEKNPSPVNILEYFYFVDVGGNIIEATAGTVTVLCSPDNGDTYQTLNNNVFDATDATLESRTKPSGRGKATHLRIVLSGIVAAGAVGFSTYLTQEM